MRGIKIEIICDGELVNGYSNGGKYYGGWNNPFDVLPPVGSIIEYATFNQGSKEGQGVTTCYTVKGYKFTTEEDYNHSFINQVCKVYVYKTEEN